MRLNDLSPAKGANKKPKRVGRGVGSGHGKTSCRGHKGQKSRSGYSAQPGFEGGQMPLARRLPKRGFTNIFKKQVQIVNVERLNRFKKDSTVTRTQLQEQRMINQVNLPVKVLGKGKVTKPLHLQVQAISKQAKDKIEQAGGKVEIIK
ncbi:50S ribosomal protein L15 [Candidatus Omnitrophota bacterium]